MADNPNPSPESLQFFRSTERYQVFQIPDPMIEGNLLYEVHDGTGMIRAILSEEAFNIAYEPAPEATAAYSPLELEPSKSVDSGS